MDAFTPLRNPHVDPIVNLTEENAIRRLQNHYIFLLDNHEYDPLSAVFTDDAVLDYGPPFSIIHGPAALAGVLKKTLGVVLQQHIIASQLISVHAHSSGTEPTHASSLSCIIAEHFGIGEDEGKALTAYPRSEDRLVRVDGVWKICQRKLTYLASGLTRRNHRLAVTEQGARAQAKGPEQRPHEGDVSVFGNPDFSDADV